VVSQHAFSAFTAEACPAGPIEGRATPCSDTSPCEGSGQTCVEGQCYCDQKECQAGGAECFCAVGNRACVAKSCYKEASKVGAEVDQLEGEVSRLTKDAAYEEGEEGAVGNAGPGAQAQKLEERSANFIKLPKSTQKIKDVIKEIKGALEGPSALAAAPMTMGARPGIETLVAETGEDGLGASVKDFSGALQDMVETVNNNLKKDRIAMMTTQDIPSVLRDTVVEMNNVNRVATYLRQKLAAVTELSNLELGRAGAVGHARLKVGPGAPVTDVDEAQEAEREKIESLKRCLTEVNIRQQRADTQGEERCLGDPACRH